MENGLDGVFRAARQGRSIHAKFGEPRFTCALPPWFVHNHPIGDPAPSPEDQEITRRLKDTGDTLDIRVLDHVVLGSERFYSFSDQGLI